MIQLTSKSHHENLLASLHQLRLQGLLSDVTVQVDYQGDVQDFRAHQVMLAASSGFFKKIFLSPDATHDKVLLSDMHFSNFSKFLEFVYTGKVEVARDKIGEVLEAAEFLDCEDLALVCGEAMSAGILQNPSKKTCVPEVAEKDELHGAKTEKGTKGKKQPRSILKRQLSPKSSETEVILKRKTGTNNVMDEKRPVRKLKLTIAGRKVLQRRINTKRVHFDGENQASNDDTEEDEDSAVAEHLPENVAEKADETSVGMPASDVEDWEYEEDEQSNDPEDILPLSLGEEEEEEEEEEEGESKKTLKRTSKAQFQCNKCQRTFHYERSYLKHIR